jgi:hypothetical protein
LSVDVPPLLRPSSNSTVFGVFIETTAVTPGVT